MVDGIVRYAFYQIDVIDPKIIVCETSFQEHMYRILPKVRYQKISMNQLLKFGYGLTNRPSCFEVAKMQRKKILNVVTFKFFIVKT